MSASFLKRFVEFVLVVGKGQAGSLLVRSQYLGRIVDFVLDEAIDPVL